MPSEDETLTPRENEIVNYYLDLRKDGHKSPNSATAEFFAVKPQYISQVKNKYERILERKQKTLMREYGDFSQALQDFRASTRVREEMMIKLQSLIERLDDRESKMNQCFSELELLVENMYADPDDDKTNFEVLKKVKKILISRNSPLHTIALIAEQRKLIDQQDKIMKSSTATLEKMVRTQQMIMDLNPDELPIERQKELLRWYVKNYCSVCPGDAYRKDDLERRKKALAKQDNIRKQIDNGTVVDV